MTIKDTTDRQVGHADLRRQHPGTVGGGTAYVGFTGGTGGLTATQDILTWTFSPNAAQSPERPSGLGATPASATSVNLTWTNNATNQTGLPPRPRHRRRLHPEPDHRRRCPRRQPARSPTPPPAWRPAARSIYRLRAFNSAGDSGQLQRRLGHHPARSAKADQPGHRTGTSPRPRST